MHKTLFVRALLVLTAGAPAAWAQQSRVGLKAGGTLSGFSGPDANPGGSNRAGLCAGVVLHLPVSQVFAVQPEFLYVQKGATAQPFAIGSSATVKGSQRLHYLEIPVLVKVRSRGGFFGELGPTLGYVLSASATFPNLSQQVVTIDNRGLFKAFDWGYAVGVGFQTDKGLLLGVRYNEGFSALATAGAYRGISGEARIHNQAFQLYAGYIFFGRPAAEFPE